MVPTAVHPELRDAWAKAPKLPYHKLERLRVMRRASAAMGKTPLVEGVTAENVDANGVGLRVYRASRADGVLLWMHGGGLLLGTPEQDDARCSAWAKALGIAVVSVRYRCAPEDPFPAAADDCLEGWRYACALDLGPAVVGGVSAGGGLAATLCQRLRSTTRPMPRGQLLLWPMLDDRTAADEGIDATAHVVWNNRSNAAGWGAYLGCPPGAGHVPAFSVASRCDDLHGLPPAWIGVGSLDLFAAECRAYARRLHEAEVAVTLDEVLGAFHDFTTLAPDTEIARSCEARQQAFLRRVLG
jgi:acetyl esterase/lipase